VRIFPCIVHAQMCERAGGVQDKKLIFFKSEDSPSSLRRQNKCRLLVQREGGLRNEICLGCSSKREVISGLRM